MVWKFHRFARSVSHLLKALDTFRALGIDFVSLPENLDTSTPAGRMVFTVLGEVEIRFAKIQRHVIDRGIFTSVADLSRKLMRHIRAYAKVAKAHPVDLS